MIITRPILGKYFNATSARPGRHQKYSELGEQHPRRGSSKDKMGMKLKRRQV